MPRFRSTRAQAEYAISQKIALGSGRHDHQNDGCIHSVGTARGYEQALKGFAEYLQANHQGDLQSATEKEAQEYLANRAAMVAQKTLDLDRQAIQMHLGVTLEVVKSEKETIFPPGVIPLNRSTGLPPLKLSVTVWLQKLLVALACEPMSY